jgi:glycosyltransferase involved in cell wall biosynthesis
MPFYNSSEYLAEALNSVQNQTLVDIEIIAVNDGSTDNSLTIAEEHASKDKRIIVVDKPNGGYGDAMNRGIETATGEYIGFVDTDDYIEYSMYEKLYSISSAHNLDFIRSDYRRFYDLADRQRLFQYMPVSQNEKYYNVVFNPQKDINTFSLSMQNWTGIYSKEFLRKNNIWFNESPGASFQDNGFWFQTYMWSTKAFCLNKAFYNYRRDNPASSVAQTDKVHVMLDEYAWIKTVLSTYPDMYRKLISIFHYKKTHNCFFAFTRLAPEYQMEFLKRYRREFQEAIDYGEIDRSLFEDYEWLRLQSIIRNPDAWLQEWRAGETKRLRDETRERNKLIVKQYDRFTLMDFLRQEGGLLHAIKGSLHALL